MVFFENCLCEIQLEFYVFKARLTRKHSSRLCTARLSPNVFQWPPLGVDRILDTHLWKHYLPQNSFPGDKNKFLMDNNNKTIHRPVRNEGSSCRVFKGEIHYKSYCEPEFISIPNFFLYRLDRYAVILYLAFVRSGVRSVYTSVEVPRLPLGRNHRNRHPRHQLHGLLLRRYVHLSLIYC